ncbi:type II toxin-antitoxin system PemK/MazF family toxin [Clostridium sp. 'deep sea']|uniref:type II toxin-antitoxin system PemK/MazF family toxin n=1 Tax=Clostridium sp. 'deep sea' TaxID=2779445 RepID=UPI0018968EC9|nr:type II toxin-antitoxin system PemK/MazF family toxin [Clostridium sp. 'deep sea']QOR37012.1 type II toxin-antitoxin system PemK/MazF family toxin [Clostridium sp. 'deep sea']
MIIKRGEVYQADLNPVVGSEQGGKRPVLVIQNDIGNAYSPTVIVAAITSQINKSRLPTHVELLAEECGLEKDSVLLLEQVRTIDKQRLIQRITELDPKIMSYVNEALKISLGLVCF